MKKIAACLCLLLLILMGLIFINPAKINAADDYKPMTPSQIDQELSDFSKAGADAYLIWNYAGERNDYFGNDVHSFFKDIDAGPDICQTLNKHKNDAIKVGVNIYDLGDSKYSDEKISKNLQYLHDSCGVKIVRIFAWAGGASGVDRVLRIASQFKNPQLQIVVSIGDYSNSQGGMEANPTWYGQGNKAAYDQLVNGVIGAVKKYPDVVYGVELANEPHCGGAPTVFGDYQKWVATYANRIKSGAGVNVGIGQMASQKNGACDTPHFPAEGNQSHYYLSNSDINITIASGHYYNGEEKAQNIKAAAVAKSLGKKFYVGEAGWGGATSAEQEPYYLYPIPNLKTGDPSTIADTLLEQGYQVSCGTPKITLTAQQGGLAEYTYPGTILRVDSKYELDAANSKIPIWRQENDSSSRFKSLETFWGFKDIKQKDEIAAQTASAPLYSLLTLEQQCVYQVRILETIDKMCNKLEDPSTCALYQDIPGFEGKYTTGGYGTPLLAEFKNQMGYSDINQLNIACAKINDKNLTSDQTKTFKALGNVPLYLDKAYRLAFLVISAEQKDNGVDSFFKFLADDRTTADPKHVVKVIAFKLPDIGSNKQSGDRSSPDNLAYDDALTITKKAVQEYDPQLEKEEKKNEIKRTMQNIVKSIQALFGEPAINCGGDLCGEPGVQALVKMINANNDSCEANPKDLPFEPVNTIKDSGLIEGSKGTTFKQPEGEIVDSLKTNHNINQAASFNFISNIKLNAQGDAQTKVKSFLVLPYGYEIEDVQNTLLGLYINDGELENFKAQNPQYFKIDQLAPNLTSSKPQTNYLDYSRIPNSENCKANRTCSAEATLEMNEESKKDNEPRIPGGWLGSTTRFVQKSSAEFGSNPWNFISSCKTTEDYLLGRCGDNNTSGQTLNLSCNSYQGGYPVSSNNLRSVMQKAASDNGVNIALLNVLAAGENCKHANDSTNINLCTKSDQDYSSGNYLNPGTVMMYNGHSFNNCPKNSNSEKYKGPFVMTALSYPENWNGYMGQNSEVCSVNDNMNALAKVIASIQYGQSSDPNEMKQFMVRFVLGGGAKNTKTNKMPTCEEAMLAEQQTPGSDGEDEICSITYGSANYCSKRAWIWALDNYCCAIDKAMGISTSKFCDATTDVWMDKITPVTAGSCK